MTVIVNVIKSFDGIKTIQNFISQQKTPAFEVKEESSGKTWVNFGGFNGNIWDLWLQKKGTLGATKTTFIRAYCKKDSDINRELRSWGLLAPETAEEKEAAQTAAAVENERQRALIIAAVTVDRAREWLGNDEGNSHTRRTRWGNRAARIGASRNFGNYLHDYCNKIFDKI